MEYKYSSKQKVTPAPNNTIVTVVTKPIVPLDTVSDYIATMEQDMSDTRHVIELGELVPDLYVKTLLT